MKRKKGSLIVAYQNINQIVIEGKKIQVGDVLPCRRHNYRVLALQQVTNGEQRNQYIHVICGILSADGKINYRECFTIHHAFCDLFKKLNGEELD